MWRLAAIARRGAANTETLYTVRCERGAEIARMIELPESTAQAIRALDEHWDGGGTPYGLRGDQIPLAARIMASCRWSRCTWRSRAWTRRSTSRATARGTWFDPALVDALLATRGDGRSGPH